MIFVDEQIPLVASALSADFNVRTFVGRTLTHHDLINNNVTALFVRSTTNVNESLLSGTNVSFVGSATAGIDHIDVDYLNANSIRFAYAPGSNSQAVCDYIISVLHILNFLKIESDSDSNSPSHSNSNSQLLVGVIGRGHVGSKVDAALQALSVKTLVSDPPLGIHTPLEKIFAESDVVTLHIPLTDNGKWKTENIVTQELLSLMKPTAVLINTARAGVIANMEHGTWNVEHGTWSKEHGSSNIVLDVWRNEPNVDPDQVADTLIATPHIAGYTKQAKVNGATTVLGSFLGSMKDGGGIVIPTKEEGALNSEIGIRNAELSISKRIELIRSISLEFKEAWKRLPPSITFDELRKVYLAKEA